MLILQNTHWQTGILPNLGGSLAYGRLRYSGTWVDVIRPTPPDAPPIPGSFLMLPWANRIRNAILRFEDQTWALHPTPDDGTARHGDVRKRPWQVIEHTEAQAVLQFNSTDFDDFNFPFTLQAEQQFALADRDFLWRVSLTNTDSQPFPAGFGFHPYFQPMSRLQIPCQQQYILTHAMPDAGPIPIQPDIDFRQPRPLPGDIPLDHLLTGRSPGTPIHLFYDDWNLDLQIHADPIFQHVIVFTAPDGTIAVEPQTNANDGFNLYADGIPGSGIFVIQPGETIAGTVRLHRAGSA